MPEKQPNVPMSGTTMTRLVAKVHPPPDRRPDRVTHRGKDGPRTIPPHRRVTSSGAEKVVQRMPLRKSRSLKIAQNSSVQSRSAMGPSRNGFQERLWKRMKQILWYHCFCCSTCDYCYCILLCLYVVFAVLGRYAIDIVDRFCVSQLCPKSCQRPICPARL